MIGNRLKNLLEELNIKQNELAQKSQVTEATISNYISGKQLPKLGVVERIADTLNVSVDYLLGRDVYRTGNRIKQLRLQKGINQEVLAKKLGITQQMVSLYEKNINEPDIETIKKLSEIFNCSIDYLLGKNESNNNTYNTKTKVEQILELADGLNIQEANYLIKQLNKAVIKIEKR